MAKLIIVEDDPFLLSILAEKLKETGFDIETAIDGEDGLNKIKKNNFNLILLDMVLPQIDGFKIMEELRKDERLNKIPVICPYCSTSFSHNLKEIVSELNGKRLEYSGI